MGVAVSKYRVKLMFNAFWAIPVAVLMRALSPFVKIRICRIFSERIGHFVTDVAEHLARSNMNSRTFDIFYFGKEANQQWAKMARRTDLKILGSWVFYLDRWSRLLPGSKNYILKSSLTQSRDVENLNGRFQTEIPFLYEEDLIGKSWLKSKGWTDGEPFICLLIRDSEYLQKNFSHLNIDFNYHDYRDSDANTYSSAIKWLNSKGVWVLRMGKQMAKPLVLDSSRFVDYAFDSEKSDLLDIWLFANSTGVVSTATGLDQLAMIYQKPQLYVNALPLSHLHSWADMIWVPKKLIWAETGIKLSISEQLENGFYVGNQYVEAGIEIIDLNQEEILQAVKEFWWKICGCWEYKTIEIERQDRFWQIFKAWKNYDKVHGFHHPNAVVGNAWLMSTNVELLK